MARIFTLEFLDSLRRRLVLAALLVAFVAVVAAVHRWWTRPPTGALAIATNGVIWGPQFAVVLGALPAWQAAGEQNVTIVGDQLIGERRLADEQSASAARVRMRQLLAGSRPALDAIGDLFHRWRSFDIDVARLAPLAADQALDVLRDDGGFRVAARVPHAAVLADRLTLSVLTRELGSPEQVVDRVVRSGFEGRSEGVTEYVYLQNAFRFATSTYAPIVAGTGERHIGRARLDVARLAAMTAR